MTVPVWVEQKDGKYTASVLGMQQLQVSADTRDDAIRELSKLVSVFQARGVLVAVNMPELPVAEIPRRQLTEEEIEATQEMVAEIYRERDEEKAAILAEYDRPPE